MKKSILVLFIVVLSILLFANEKLTIYTYESLDWVNEQVIGIFEKQNDCEVEVVKVGDGGNLLSRLVLEKNNPKADVVIGLNQSLSLKAKKENLFLSYKPENIKNIKDKNLIYDNDYFLIPYDFGSIAIIYNPDEMDIVPRSFDDITLMYKSLIIQDPRTSSTGQAFLLWTIAVYQDNWKDFWKDLKTSILTVSPGWSESFAKYETGEAPMMVSYATDGAYTQYYYESNTSAFIPEDGAYVEVEGAGIINGTDNLPLAKKFMEFILSDDFQSQIPLNQWMFPVTNVKLPDVFKYAINPNKILELPSEMIEENLEKWLEEWEEIMY